ncbi:MAG: response regulator transcription factor [Solirubrobacterales bacterium]
MSLVLVAEDSASVRLLLHRRLEMAGHEVIEAQDGREALSMAGSAETHADVVILDAMMPGATGPSVLNGIKQLRPELPVIVVSAMPDLALSEEWQAADERMRKPIDFDELLGRVEALTP